MPRPKRRYACRESHINTAVKLVSKYPGKPQRWFIMLQGGVMSTALAEAVRRGLIENHSGCGYWPVKTAGDPPVTQP